MIPMMPNNHGGPTQTEIRSFCDRYLPGWTEANGTKGPEAMSRCPFCSSGGRKGRHAERTFRVSLTDGRWICNRHENCSQRGGWLTLVERLSGGRPVSAPRELIQVQTERKSFKLPPEEAARSSAQNHVSYLEGRGIPIEVITAWRCGYRDGCMVWPIYDDQGVLIDVKRRTIAGKGFFHELDARPGLVGMHLLRDDIDVLTIVEGEIDAMSATVYGLQNVVSMPGGTGDLRWVEEWLPWLDRFTEIAIALDDDAAGRVCAVELAKRIGHWRCSIVTWPRKDLNECLSAGITQAEIVQALDNANPVTPDALVSMLDLEDDIVAAFFDEGRLVGVPSGFPGLDGLLRGFRPGELTVWTGQNGSGKSTVLGQVMSNVVVQHGARACVASLELPVARYSRWLIMQTAGSSQLDEQTIRATVRQLGEGMWMIDHVGVMDVERLIDIWTYARRRYDVRQFVVDSMMRLKLGVDDYTSQKNAVDKLVAFCRTFDCHVHLVAHPRKGANDAHAVDKAAIKGTSEITDLAHNVIVITRKPDHSTLELLKHREHGTLGTIGLEVDPESKTVRETAIETEKKNEPAKRRRNPREISTEQDRPASRGTAAGRDHAAGRDDRHEFIDELDPGDGS